MTHGVVQTRVARSSRGNGELTRALTGSSIAAAVASGTAGLIWSYRPELRPDQIVDIICPYAPRWHARATALRYTHAQSSTAQRERLPATNTDVPSPRRCVGCTTTPAPPFACIHIGEPDLLRPAAPRSHCQSSLGQATTRGATTLRSLLLIRATLAAELLR
jgi:hypothetical protein